MQNLSNLGTTNFDPETLNVPVHGQAPMTHKIVGRKRETAQLAPLNHAAYTGGKGNNSQTSNY